VDEAQQALKPPVTVLYTAAHGGYSASQAPLGGGAAICDWLAAEWGRTKPFELRLLTPLSVLGESAPAARDLVAFGERDYGRFCRRFEAAVTQEILKHDPASTIVLSNDVSEGPHFWTLHRQGYRLFTIYHVDVVAYIAAMYCRGWVKPRTLARWYDIAQFFPVPDILRLIFEKQWASVEYSRGLIVPSSAMNDVLLESYEDLLPERVHVLPWGLPDEHPDPEAVSAEVAAVRREFGMPDDALVLLTLSRISPEKGQDRLLEALRDWKRLGELPERPLWVFVCGEAAYMQGRRFERRLRRLAEGIAGVRIVFPGHVTGLRKRAFLALAEIYVFPSRHESYGLTLLEAMRAGLPAVCFDHHGAREVMRPEFGAIVSTRGQLIGALEILLNDDRLRGESGEAARRFAERQRFDVAAARLAEILLS
jgi:glycosyltransferase involved in cell wall biosynthesis